MTKEAIPISTAKPAKADNLLNRLDDTDFAQLSALKFEDYSNRRDNGDHHDDIMNEVARQTGKRDSGATFRKCYRVYIVIRAMEQSGMISGVPFDVNEVAVHMKHALADIGTDVSLENAKREVQAAMSIIVDSNLIVRLPHISGLAAQYATHKAVEVMDKKLSESK